MNIYGIFRILSMVLGLEGGFLMLPAIVGLVYKEYRGAAVYALVGLAALLLSGVSQMIMKRHKPRKYGFYIKEGFVATAMSWIVLSLVGAVPFVVTGDIPHYVDALFEVVSGFTTTGASILNDVECLLHCNLFFRSFSHWIGGMGVLVFILAVLPMNGGSPLSLMKAESPGPTVSKLVPKLRDTALILYGLYIALTVIEFVLLLFDDSMSAFEAICHTLGTAGTGGFGVRNASVAEFSTYVQVVTTVFMVLFGFNFTFYYLLLARQFKLAFGMEELRWYLGFYFGAIVLAIVALVTSGWKLGDIILPVFFTCASLMTTTGYTVADFGQWPVVTHVIFVLLMFIGGCAGSTAGGFKVSRVMTLLKQTAREVRQQIHPKRVYVIKADQKPLTGDVIKSTNNLLVVYLVILLISLMLVSLNGFDLTTTFGAVMATYNNIGVGLGEVCVGGSFGIFNDFSKLVMIFDMLAGRLEILPMLLLFHPQTWKK